MAFFFLEIIAHYQYVLSNTSVMVNPEDEPILVTNQGIIIRQAADAIPTQSRKATGVRVQRLNEDDAIAACSSSTLSPSRGSARRASNRICSTDKNFSKEGNKSIFVVFRSYSDMRSMTTDISRWRITSPPVSLPSGLIA